MQLIKRGENAVIKRLLKKKDKTAFNRSEFTTLAVDLIQNGQVVTSLTYPSINLRAGTADNEIELELTTTVSATLSAGKVVAKYTIVAPDAEFATNSATIIITEEILDVNVLP